MRAGLRQRQAANRIAVGDAVDQCGCSGRCDCKNVDAVQAGDGANGQRRIACVVASVDVKTVDCGGGDAERRAGNQRAIVRRVLQVQGIGGQIQVEKARAGGACKRIGVSRGRN